MIFGCFLNSVSHDLLKSFRSWYLVGFWFIDLLFHLIFLLLIWTFFFFSTVAWHFMAALLLQVNQLPCNQLTELDNFLILSINYHKSIAFSSYLYWVETMQGRIWSKHQTVSRLKCKVRFPSWHYNRLSLADVVLIQKWKGRTLGHSVAAVDISQANMWKLWPENDKGRHKMPLFYIFQTIKETESPFPSKCLHTNLPIYMLV